MRYRTIRNLLLAATAATALIAAALAQAPQPPSPTATVALPSAGPADPKLRALNLPNGKKIQVPFDQLIIFSTNLQPRDLVDEAFLRRIPYKIDVADPTEDEFRQLVDQGEEAVSREHTMWCAQVRHVWGEIIKM